MTIQHRAIKELGLYLSLSAYVKGRGLFPVHTVNLRRNIVVINTLQGLECVHLADVGGLYLISSIPMSVRLR